MIAFFDTNVHIDVLRGIRSLADILATIGNLRVRLSPVVASELLRGVSGHGTRSVTPISPRSAGTSPLR